MTHHGHSVRSCSYCLYMIYRKVKMQTLTDDDSPAAPASSHLQTESSGHFSVTASLNNDVITTMTAFSSSNICPEREKSESIHNKALITWRLKQRSVTFGAHILPMLVTCRTDEADVGSDNFCGSFSQNYLLIWQVEKTQQNTDYCWPSCRL